MRVGILVIFTGFPWGLRWWLCSGAGLIVDFVRCADVVGEGVSFTGRAFSFTGV